MYLQNNIPGQYQDTDFLDQAQSGQTTVLLALSMMVLICFLAFMVNVGQLVHDRILTQNVADMVALSAANIQAAGMNELADLNWEYRELQQDFDKYLGEGSPFASRGDVENLVEYFRGWMDLVKTDMDIANEIFPLLSQRAAEQTLEWYNDRYGGFQIESLDHSNPLCELMHTAPLWLSSQYLVPAKVPPRQAHIAVQWRDDPIHEVMISGTPQPFIDVLTETYMEKLEERLTYLVVSVSRETRPVFVNLPDLGFDVEIPRMEAWAGLIPTGGNIEQGNPQYSARFVPLEFLGYGQFRH